MKHIFFIITLLLTFQIKANINHIDLSKISNDNRHKEIFQKIKNNESFYNHWEVEWNYEKSKDELIDFLEEAYTEFSKIKSQEIELYLLLGSISHYLYNLDKTEFYEIAIDDFSKVIAQKPKEFRAYWFLGTHYSLSNNPNEAIENFLKAKELLPNNEPADFWENFAFATAMANMPSHSIYAMDKVKELTGLESYFELLMGDVIRNRIVHIDKTKDYEKKEIWTAKSADMMTFISRPLGMKILVVPTWELSIYDYNNRQSAFIMTPTSITNKKGRKIDYTIAILMKTVDTGDNLEDYINNFISKYSSKKKIKFSDKYEKIIAYKIMDKSMYEDIGGANLYMIGIERTSPEYPGLLLESPASIPDGNPEELTYYRASDSQNRFEGKIFYLIMLDSCKDIHKKSFAVFKEFFEKQLIIE